MHSQNRTDWWLNNMETKCHNRHNKNTIHKTSSTWKISRIWSHSHDVVKQWNGTGFMPTTGCSYVVQWHSRLSKTTTWKLTHQHVHPLRWKACLMSTRLVKRQIQSWLWIKCDLMRSVTEGRQERWSKRRNMNKGRAKRPDDRGQKRW